VSRLRIISGKFGGRFIKAPDGRTTHPMGDRVRSALFNMVGVEGKTVLDAYAGSGAIGLEALSRGAERVDLVEKDKKAQRVIQENIESLRVEEQTKLYKMTVGVFIKMKESESAAPTDNHWILKQVQNDRLGYDIIFADPPYHDLQLNTISKLVGLMKKGGLMILSYPGNIIVPEITGAIMVDKRSYGDASLVFYRLK